MEYYDMDYNIKIENNAVLREDDVIYDCFIKRFDHYCEKTDSYWENIQDEALYLKVKTSDDIDKVVCICKNEVQESTINFENPMQKEDFYQVKHEESFYNTLEVYLTLNDKQAIELLDIMRKNIDDYDYNFQYCNGVKIIKNLVKPNLDNKDVEKAYSLYLEKTFHNEEIDNMVKDCVNSNIIQFPGNKNGNRK